MGICSSCDSGSAVSTVKLIMQDGRLQEFSSPIKASSIMQKDPSCFICNSDDMDFDGVLPAVSADEELLPGQLYFALPLSRLHRPLQAEEMAALAVKANSALTKSGCGDSKCCCCRKRVCDIGIEKKTSSGSGRVDSGGGRGRGLGLGRASSDVGTGVGLTRGRSGRHGGDRRGRFAARLTAIPE